MSRIRNALSLLAIAAALSACGHSAPAPADTLHRESNAPALALDTSTMTGEEIPTVTVSAKRETSRKPQI